MLTLEFQLKESEKDLKFLVNFISENLEHNYMKNKKVDKGLRIDTKLSEKPFISTNSSRGKSYHSNISNLFTRARNNNKSFLSGEIQLQSVKNNKNHQKEFHLKISPSNLLTINREENAKSSK